MDVSENSGTPTSSILIGFSIINHPFWGTPIFWKRPYSTVMHLRALTTMYPTGTCRGTRRPPHSQLGEAHPSQIPWTFWKKSSQDLVVEKSNLWGISSGDGRGWIRLDNWIRLSSLCTGFVWKFRFLYPANVARGSGLWLWAMLSRRAMKETLVG